MDKYTATEQAYKHGYEKGYEAGKPKWIPVTERLPDKNGEYICRHTDKSVHSAEYESIYGSFGYWFDFWEDEYKEWIDYEGVTHWMPLPAAPERIDEK